MAGPNIGDVMLRVLADMAGFETEVVKEAQKTGDKAGQTMSQRLGSSLKANAGKVFFGAMSLAAGVATKGVLELEEATASFRAETGATAEEAEAAGKAINAMAGRNIQPLEEVGRTLEKVHTDLGLAGEAAEASAESFLKYGRATGRDAAEGVTALDDILDAWNLDAERSGEIMDKLIASHQEYGGSITENEKALSNLAPQLQALNLDVDDGIGLLNLFSASGLDASKAQFALNSAIQKLPEGESLDEFIARLSTIEDDGERARVAIEVFGARGGAGLANAIRPGVDSLADFTISTEEAAGATQEAADALDSTWGSRFKLLLKGAGSALTGFGAQFGPALTGMASLASLAGSLGGGKIVSGILGPIGGLGKKLGTKLVQQIGIAFAGTAIANAAAAGLSEGLEIGTERAVSKVGKMGLAKRIAGAIGTIAVPVALAVVFTEVAEGAQNEARRMAQETARKAAASGNQEIIAQAIKDLEGFKRYAERGGDEAAAAYFDGLIQSLRVNGPGSAAAIDAALSAKADRIPAAIAGGIERGTPAVTGAVQGMTGSAALEMQTLLQEAHAVGSQTPAEVAAGILDRQDDIDSGMAALRHQIETERTPSKQAAHVLGNLISSEVANGLVSKREGVRAAAEDVRTTGEAELAEFIRNGGKIGKKAMDELIAAEKSKDPDVRAQARRTRQIIETGVVPNTKPAGKAAVTGITSELNKGKGRVGTAAANLAGVIVKRIVGTIYSTTSSGQVSGGGVSGTRHTGGPVTADRMYLVGRPGAEELFVPSTSGRIYPGVEQVQPAGPMGGNTYNVNLTGLPKVRTPRDIVDTLRMAGEMGHLGMEPG
jgi:hypothetical protein